MTKNEINDCKKTINDFFGKNAFDNLLGIFGVTEQDLENVKEDETDKDILNEEFNIDINNIFNIFDDFLDNDTNHNKENRKNINIEEIKENDEKDKKELSSELPSNKLKDLNKKLDIHKIVQEYVTEENISNDDYAKLFEFACWLINK